MDSAAHKEQKSSHCGHQPSDTLGNGTLKSTSHRCTFSWNIQTGSRNHLLTNNSTLGTGRSPVGFCRCKRTNSWSALRPGLFTSFKFSQENTIASNEIKPRHQKQCRKVTYQKQASLCQHIDIAPSAFRDQGKLTFIDTCLKTETNKTHSTHHKQTTLYVA